MSETLSKLIRRAILESGKTRYRIACECRVDQATLSRFITGKSTLSQDTIDKLVAGLGIEVRLPRKPKDK
jgi:transcriptional regulator with XRE-family HTH domain